MLIVATEPQKVERDLLAHEAWGQRLTPEGFAEREQRLRGHAWAREGMITWLLVSDGGEEKEGTILSSCETFRMQSFLASASAGAGDPAPETGSSYGIASVFTEPALRGRGHAVRMMSLLSTELLARWDPLESTCRHASLSIL